MALTESTIKAAKPKPKAYKLADGEGLYLEVSPGGGKYWRLKYRFAGKEKRLALGVYPGVSRDDARKKRTAAKDLLKNGVDPGQHSKALRQTKHDAASDTFEGAAREWLDLQKEALSATTLAGARRMLGYAYRHIGSRPIREITAPEVLAMLREIEAPKTKGGKPRHETAHRTKSRCSQVFRYAIAAGRADRDPTADLRGALAPVTTTNRAALTDPREVGDLLRAIDAYNGQPATVAALKLAPMLFLRPGELRAAEWREIDLDAAQWVVPAARMKMDREHVVPLAKQAVRVLRELHRLTSGGALVFPSLRRGRPLSENTLNVALRTMGYTGEQMTAHGFRAMASTLLHEEGYPPEVIETQLAHARPGVGGVYNRSHLLPQRRKMMQDWADYLDKLAVM